MRFSKDRRYEQLIELLAEIVIQMGTGAEEEPEVFAPEVFPLPSLTASGALSAGEPVRQPAIGRKRPKRQVVIPSQT